MNLNQLLSNPEQIGEICYQLRKSLTCDGDLPPKSLFANMLDCEVKDLAQIESGYIYNFPLALRYAIKLHQVKQLFSQ